MDMNVLFISELTAAYNFVYLILIIDITKISLIIYIQKKLRSPREVGTS